MLFRSTRRSTPLPSVAGRCAKSRAAPVSSTLGPKMLRVLVALVVVASAYPALILLPGGGLAEFGAVMVGIVTGGVSLLAGVPLAIWFVKQRWFKLWQSLLVGGLIGVVVGLALNNSMGFAMFVFILKFVALGCLHTAAFWVLAFWKNHSISPISAHAAAGTKVNNEA